MHKGDVTRVGTDDFARALDRHLEGLDGLLGSQVIWNHAGSGWVEVSRRGVVIEGQAELILQGFDPEAGGQVSVVDHPDAAWVASYQTAGPSMSLCLLFALSNLPPAVMHPLLDQIEARVGWLLVAAEKANTRAPRDVALSVELGAALLLEAADARDRDQLADQWIARLEKATGADAVCICRVTQNRPTLQRMSGGGIVGQPSDARTAIEGLVEAAIRARTPVFSTAETLPEDLIALKIAQAVTLPVYRGDPCEAGIVLLWRDAAADVPDAQAVELIASVLGEAVGIQDRAHPSLLRRLGNWGGNVLRTIFGARRAKVKLALLLVVGTVIAAGYVETRYKPSFQARVEARDRSVAAAPFDGFIQEAPVRLGDTVQPGQILFEMDVTELRLDLEEQKAASLRLASDLNVARAKRDTAEVRRLTAEQEQALIRAELVDQRIAQGVVRAATPGVVVAGDAWRRLGARVRLGDPLVELARPDGLSVLAFVTEDWVADLPQSATASLKLATFPDRVIPARLEQITPASREMDGQNTFLAWFTVDFPQDLAVTDGMRGVLQVDGSPTTYLQRYGRGLFRWVDRQLWLWG